jgi:hypothetical protein
LWSFERPISSIFCDFAQFAVLVSFRGSVWQREQQPDVSIDLAAKQAIHARVKE